MTVLEVTAQEAAKATIELKENADPYTIFGKEQIEEGALNQMNIAMRLPVTVAGALMPDAHQGYGLPIGAAAMRAGKKVVVVGGGLKNPEYLGCFSG